MSRNDFDSSDVDNYEEDENEENLLNTEGNETSERTGSVNDDFQKSFARKLGWVDQDEWKDKGRAKGWVPAEQFLDKIPDTINALRESKKRIAITAEATMAQERLRVKAEAEAELRKAIQEGNTDQAIHAAQKAASTNTIDPQVTDWVKRNPWFNTDPEAHAVAMAANNVAVNRGMSTEDTLEHVENTVRKRFPEHFDDDEQEEFVPAKRETRNAPAVQSGTRGVSSKIRTGTTWEDIPSGDRKDLGRFVPQMMNSKNKLDQKTIQARLAKSYWNTKGK